MKKEILVMTDMTMMRIAKEICDFHRPNLGSSVAWIVVDKFHGATISKSRLPTRTKDSTFVILYTDGICAGMCGAEDTVTDEAFQVTTQALWSAQHAAR